MTLGTGVVLRLPHAILADVGKMLGLEAHSQEGILETSLVLKRGFIKAQGQDPRAEELQGGPEEGTIIYLQVGRGSGLGKVSQDPGGLAIVRKVHLLLFRTNSVMTLQMYMGGHIPGA